MPPGRTALTPSRDMVHGILARGRLRLVPVNRLKVCLHEWFGAIRLSLSWSLFLIHFDIWRLARIAAPPVLPQSGCRQQHLDAHSLE
jgi:hypothetical protein